MKSQKSGVRSQKLRVRSQKSGVRSQELGIILLMCFSLFTFHFSLFTAASAAKWGGVDESVVEKYAEEHGRAARDPIINTDQGDLLLFLFLLGGAIGGFAAGYYWRTLTKQKTRETEEHYSK
jgi:ABC-type cobalt transport system substrate-binding protein